MKKFLSLLLICVMVISSLSGCGKKSEPLSGKELAKLYLANERLNAELLNKEGDIFENGTRVMETLAERAVKNLGVDYVLDDTLSVTKLSSVNFAPRKTSVTVDGGNYIWSDFKENNNSYDYFKNITDGIVSNAKVASDLIDNIKKNVRVVDKWVDMNDGNLYYLHVDENSEILCEKNTDIDRLAICMRYKNGAGKDVYELYLCEDKFTSRMTYIPGERYEMSSINDHGDHAEDYFVADNSKGYWENYVVGAFPDHYNVTYFIMKDSICYGAFYEPKDSSIPMVKIMSADREADIFYMNDYDVGLHCGAFDGIKNIAAPSNEITDLGDGVFVANLATNGVHVNLTNGKTLRVGDTFVDGKVEITTVYTNHYGLFGYTGEILMRVDGESRAERMANLKAFINEVGLRCRRDINTVIADTDRAYVELDSITKYYAWHGINVSDEAGIAAAINVEKLCFDEMYALYDEVKDAPVLDYSNTKLIELNIKFAPITERNASGAVLDGMKVSVSNVSLTIEDTTLYVKDEPYKVAFAMIGKNADSGLIHFEVDNPTTVSYADENKFTVSANNVSFEMPVLSEGEYTVVAYIATSDGIRASEYTVLPFDSVSEAPMEAGRIGIFAKLDEDGAVSVSYKENNDLTVSLTSDKKLGYSAFCELVAAEVFNYGTPSELLDTKSGEEFVSLSGEETEIADGIYRMKYSVQNGENIKEGYVYIEYACVA